MIRTISHSEVAVALDCFAKHAFAYTGALTDGAALDSKRSVPQLRDGRAWGEAVQMFHSSGSVAWAHRALTRSLEEDHAEAQAAGMADDAEFATRQLALGAMLDHYTRSIERVPLLDTEHEIVVPLPSRRSNRASTRYRLRCFLDGVHLDAEGRTWIVEFKLRSRLHSYEQIEKSRQIRWYAWAWWRHAGVAPAGVIVDERLNGMPNPVRYNQDGRVSRVQTCEAGEYECACIDADQEPDAAILDALRGKAYQQTHRVFFRAHELEEAGWQLQSAARLVQQLDAGVLYPIRNPSPSRCPGCQFREICDTPHDGALVDSLFNRVLPKRSRPSELEAA